jgi:hypothetical protein
VLNYSWKASPNRWGHQEFNSTLSIGFGNWLMYQVHTFPLNYVLVCTEYILVHTGIKCMFSGTYFRLKVCTRYILQGHKMVCTCTSMYLVHTITCFFT